MLVLISFDIISLLYFFNFEIPTFIHGCLFEAKKILILYNFFRSKSKKIQHNCKLFLVIRLEKIKGKVHFTYMWFGSFTLYLSMVSNLTLCLHEILFFHFCYLSVNLNKILQFHYWPN